MQANRRLLLYVSQNFEASRIKKSCVKAALPGAGNGRDPDLIRVANCRVPSRAGRRPQDGFSGTQQEGGEPACARHDLRFPARLGNVSVAPGFVFLPVDCSRHAGFPALSRLYIRIPDRLIAFRLPSQPTGARAMREAATLLARLRQLAASSRLASLTACGSSNGGSLAVSAESSVAASSHWGALGRTTLLRRGGRLQHRQYAQVTWHETIGDQGPRRRAPPARKRRNNASKWLCLLSTICRQQPRRQQQQQQQQQQASRRPLRRCGLPLCAR